MKTESSSKEPNSIEAQLRSLGMATKDEKREGEGNEKEADEPKLELTPEQQEELEALLILAGSEPDSNKQLELYTQIKDRLQEIKEGIEPKESILLPPAELEPNKRYRVIVKPDLEEAIMDGKYDFKNDEIISEYFPPESSEAKLKNVEVELIGINESVTSEYVLFFLEKNNLRPATIRELLALGSQFPDVQRSFQILGLGSIGLNPSGLRDIPNLCSAGSHRGINLRTFSSGWYNINYRFLAVKKEKEK